MTEEQVTARIYFTDFFGVAPALLEEYGAFDVSLVNDLPLFIDPFLLFNSENLVYQELHEEVIRYLRFLRDKARPGSRDRGELRAWYHFKEVKQNWLGFSLVGNQGSGLGPEFAQALHDNLGTIFNNFGQEQVTRSSHLEKVCLVDEGVGRDNVSDFTTCLIKGYLLEYSQTFAVTFLRPEQRGTFPVERARFNYDTESWEVGRYELPAYGDDFVLLTPKDMLTRDDTWISRRDFISGFERVVSAVADDQLRALLNNYLYSRLSRDRKQTARERDAEKRRAIAGAIIAHPEVIEYYIQQREASGEQAIAVSAKKVEETEAWLVDQVRAFVVSHLAGTAFYTQPGDTYEEARSRVLFLKHVLEDQDGYRLFYHKGQPVEREADFQRLFKLVWYATPSDVNSEVNNGRGPIDFKVSRGSADRSLVEFKLAKNPQLQRNLEKQVAIYEAASGADRSLKVIGYFSVEQLTRVQGILRELKLENNPRACHGLAIGRSESL
jgi:hypothetical protein